MRDVAFSCDARGAEYLRVAAWSVLKSYRGAEPIRLNVFEGYGGHPDESKRMMREMVAAFPNATLRYVDVESALAPYAELLKERENSRWNVFTWTPVFTPALLPDATGNVIHLDIDMLVVADLSELFELDLGDDLIAAVAEYGRGDAVITDAVWGTGILPPSVARYFNTGTLVFNVEACRRERTWEGIVEWYRAHYAVADRIEQDAWNALYWNRTRLLPLRWNFHDRLIRSYPRRSLSEELWQGNPPAECLRAALEPAILHFWGPKKPWRPCHRPYRKLYHAAMRAVGLKPPREEWGRLWHDFVNRRALERVSAMRERIDPLWARRREWQRYAARKRLKRAVETPLAWLGIALGLLFFSVLPHRLMLALCDVASLVYRRLDREGRTHAEANLTALFASGRVPRLPTPRERDLIVRRSYRNMARTVGHAFWTCVRSRARVQAVGEMSARAAAFLAENRPAVTVSGHIGCWEILSQLAVLNGHRMMSVAKQIGSAAMTRMLVRSRESIGQEIVSAEGAFKPLMQGIRDGKSLGLLVDQHVPPEKGGIWVRFFGRPVSVSAAPAFFAAKAKAKIVVAWSRPLRNGGYRCEYVAEHAPDEARDVWGMTQTIAYELERVIRRHPSCWALNYNCLREDPTPDALRALVSREEARRKAATPRKEREAEA